MLLELREAPAAQFTVSQHALFARLAQPAERWDDGERRRVIAAWHALHGMVAP